MVPHSLTKIRSLLSNIQLEDALLFLNHLLGVVRKDRNDEELSRLISQAQIPPQPFIIHFIAKQLLLNASNFGIKKFDWATYQQMVNLYFELGDPIVEDPNWLQTDPTGFLERFLGAQMPSQRQNMMQEMGIAQAIFSDIASKTPNTEFHFSTHLRSSLGMDPEVFIKMGFLCSTFKGAQYHHGERSQGTFTHDHLARAFAHHIDISTPEIWNPFFSRVACTPAQFRIVNEKEKYRIIDERFIQYEFNPLQRFPIIKFAKNHHITVDTRLLLHRATLGIFYDMYERLGDEFLQRFGDVFARFCGDLLLSVCPSDRIWSEEKWKASTSNKGRMRLGKLGDWAYRGDTYLILFECKSLRPSLELLTYGHQSTTEKVYDRLTAGLLQIIEQNQRIQNGDWSQYSLHPGSSICVLVTYGQLHSANGHIIRTQIENRLRDSGFTIPPFLILSITELDSFIRLVELGLPLDAVINSAVEALPSFNVLQSFNLQLTERTVSSYVHKKGIDILESIVPSHPDKEFEE